jgi:hypothetical protein
MPRPTERMAPEVRGYLQRRREAVYAVVETAPVFRKRYNDACDELEELDELLGIEAES